MGLALMTYYDNKLLEILDLARKNFLIVKIYYIDFNDNKTKEDYAIINLEEVKETLLFKKYFIKNYFRFVSDIVFKMSLCKHPLLFNKFEQSTLKYDFEIKNTNVDILDISSHRFKNYMLEAKDIEILESKKLCILGFAALTFKEGFQHLSNDVKTKLLFNNGELFDYFE